MGDTSRISMDSRSRPVRTRCRPSTSPCLTSDSHRSRLRLCGWSPRPDTSHIIPIAFDAMGLVAVYIDPMSSTHADLPVQFRLEELSDGVFGYIQPDGSWMINNTGFLAAQDGVTAIDASGFGAPSSNASVTTLLAAW